MLADMLNVLSCEHTTLWKTLSVRRSCCCKNAHFRPSSFFTPLLPLRAIHPPPRQFSGSHLASFPPRHPSSSLPIIPLHINRPSPRLWKLKQHCPYKMRPEFSYLQRMKALQAFNGVYSGLLTTILYKLTKKNAYLKKPSLYHWITWMCRGLWILRWSASTFSGGCDIGMKDSTQFQLHPLEQEKEYYLRLFRYH